jgi:hypothetical protein
MTEPITTADVEQTPVPLRWGLNDVEWADDDNVFVLLSGPNGEPYTLELEPTQATVLREDLAGPDGPAAFRAAWGDEQCGPLYGREEAARAHCEALLYRESPTAYFAWIVNEEDGVAELVVTVNGEELETGYTVTALEVASEYVEEAGE